MPPPPSDTTCAAPLVARPEASSPLAASASIVCGVLLAAGIAVVAFALRLLPGVGFLSPMILAILLGMAVQNTVGTPSAARPGVRFSLRRVLRLAIVLLGLQLTAEQVMDVGATGITIIVTTLIASFLFTKCLGHVIGVDRKLAELIAAGTSVCGASAVVATNTVTRAADEDVAYAVASVTVFGSLSMFLYPLLPAVLHLAPHAYGLWAGASIHEIAQVVGAAFQDGVDAGSFATVAKLSRVAMLAPLVLVLGWTTARRGATQEGEPSRVPAPWFVLGFLALVAVNSVVPIPSAAKGWIVPLTAFLLSVALAAMGLETDVGKLKAKGLRPLLLGACAWLFISAFSLALVELLT
jgi:uncharacterized integral membrane protein (TIGR00698 family)